jgi:hypothetical protein
LEDGMSVVERYTLDEAQLEFAKRTNGQVWQLPALYDILTSQ